MLNRPALLLATLAATNPAFADEYGWSVTPFAGYRFGGEIDIEDSTTTLELDDAASFGLLVNVVNDAKTTWEVLYSQQRTEANINDPALSLTTIDTDLYVLQLGGTYHGDGENVQPYVAMTVGGTHIRTSANGSQSDTFWSGSIGIGINVQPTRRFGIRIEARAYGTLTNSDTDLFCRTGPDLNFCAVRIEGDLLNQIETFAGFTLRF